MMNITKLSTILSADWLHSSTVILSEAKDLVLSST